MSSEQPYKPVLIVDTKGMLCQLPVFKTKQAMSKINKNEVIEVLATDPVAENDITSWVRRNGHHLLEMQKVGDVLRFLIKKA